MSNHTSPSYLMSVLRQGAAPLGSARANPSPPAAGAAQDAGESAAPSTHPHSPEAPGISQRPGDAHAEQGGGADAGRARTSYEVSDASLSSLAGATHEIGGAYAEAGAEEGTGASAGSGRRAPSDVMSPLMRAGRGSARDAAGTSPPPDGGREHEVVAVRNPSAGGHEVLAPSHSGAGLLPAGEARGGVSGSALNTGGAPPTLKGDATTSTVAAPTSKSGEGSGFTSKSTGARPGAAGTPDGGNGGEEARLVVVRRGQADAWAEEAALARAVSAEARGDVGPAPRIEFEDLGRVRPFREESWESAGAGRRAPTEAAPGADAARAASPEGSAARPHALETAVVAEAAALTLRARDEARAREDVSVVPQAPGRDGGGPRGALARGPFPPPREESPRLVINRLDVQVVNQPPAQAPAPVPAAPAEPSQAGDSWDGLERHHLGHVRLML